MEFEYVLIVVGIILAILLLYLGYTHFLKNKDLNQDTVSGMDIDSLLTALGGVDNLVKVTSSPSKLTVSLKDHQVVDIKMIQSLGASGIVEGKESLSMIFGKQSSLIEEDLKKYIK
ncbi:MAG: hypothetical protein RR585_07735 [Coprobacillus sp.]